MHNQRTFDPLAFAILNLIITEEQANCILESKKNHNFSSKPTKPDLVDSAQRID